VPECWRLDLTQDGQTGSVCATHDQWNKCQRRRAVAAWHPDRMSGETTQAEETTKHEAARGLVSGLLLDVLDHHPVVTKWGGVQCWGCDPVPRPEVSADWPCSTWLMIVVGSLPPGTGTG
jgi:hypothetical protein